MAQNEKEPAGEEAVGAREASQIGSQARVGSILRRCISQHAFSRSPCFSVSSRESFRKLSRIVAFVS